MQKAAVWLVFVTLFAAAGCSKSDNNTTSDVGGTDMAGTDQGSTNNGTDVGGDAGVDMATGEQVSIPGLNGAVTASFDDKGTLHLACEGSDDCYAAQGYYHAAHRWIQMDLQRRAPTGRLSALAGGLEGRVLNTDIASRALYSTRDGEPLEDAMWATTSEPAKKAITAYTRGVNAWLADFEAGRNGARMSEEYNQPLIDPTAAKMPWTETDTIACGLNLLGSLSNSASSDLARGVGFPKVSAEQAYDLFGTMSATQEATMPESGETYDRVQALVRWPDATRMNPALDRLRPHASVISAASENLAAVTSLFHTEGMNGSNNWVVGGSRTTSGNPVLSNDPHLSLSNPALWYLVEINASAPGDEVHVAGVSLPGVPAVVLGQNENIAWGATVVFMDLTDVYVEELTADGKSVMFNGSPEPIIEVDHTFEVARADSVTETLRFVPHHGPILSYDPAKNEAVSIRWTANDARHTFDIFFGLAKATNVDEARTAIANSASTNQNWIVADTNGDIGWFPFNALPQRPWASLAMPPWLPLPGDGSAEWGPIVPVDELPQMVNPANGYIATANTDPTGASFDGDPTNQPYGYVYSYGEIGGFRQDAINKRILAAGNSFDTATSEDMQSDTYLVLRDWVLPATKTVVDANPGTLSTEAEEFWTIVDGWDGKCPSGIDGRDPAGPKTADATIAAESIGCAAFHHLLFEMTRFVFNDEFQLASVDSDSSMAVRTLVILLNDSTRLQGGDVYWDNITTSGEVETQDTITLAAIESATTKIRNKMGTDTDDWRWGKVHTLVMPSNLFSLISPTFNAGPYAAGGGMHAINVADTGGASAGNWSFSHGPSMRHVSEFSADGVQSYWTFPGGQRHFRDSPHYDDLLDGWLAVDHFAMPFKPADVTAAAVETVTINP